MLSEAPLRTATNFDFSQFYLSADGPLNRQQGEFRLSVPLLVIGVVLSINRYGARYLQPAERSSFCSSGAIWLLIELGFFAGTPGPNRYGPSVMDPVDANLGAR